MEQIVVWVKNKEKANVLLELLTALDFVDSVKIGEAAEVEAGSTIIVTTTNSVNLPSVR